jgi:hypothetical protein
MPLAFLDELSAAISVASTTVPALSSRPLPPQHRIDRGERLDGKLVLLKQMLISSRNSRLRVRLVVLHGLCGTPLNSRTLN